MSIAGDYLDGLEELLKDAEMREAMEAEAFLQWEMAREAEFEAHFENMSEQEALRAMLEE